MEVKKKHFFAIIAIVVLAVSAFLAIKFVPFDLSNKKETMTGRFLDADDELIEIDTSEMFSRPSAEQEEIHALYIDPSSVTREKSEFVQKLRGAGRDKRALYEEYIGVIGANGILDGIEQVWPTCHSEAHDLGKVIYADVQDIGEGLRICADRCYSGCMHGVLMEAFTAAQSKDDPDKHVDIQKLKPLINETCYKNEQMISSYSPGDCSHGVGHALMFLSDYDVPFAINLCGEFDDPRMEYYCATGAYMEYVTEYDKLDVEKGKGLFHPCDTNDYPSACFRYKMVHVINRHYKANKPLSDLIDECRKLEGRYRLGCFHGLGNGHMGHVSAGMVDIRNICMAENTTEDEKFVCIEGVIERLSKYREYRALEVCETLAGKDKDTCMEAARNKMYSMTKDMSLYLEE